MSPAPTPDCPETLRLAFLDLLTWTLVKIRYESSNAKLCFALADHMHNVPELLARYRPRLLAYYWEAERPAFLRKLAEIGREPPEAFDALWEIVEHHYELLRDS
jgi:hypothetical protein